MVAGDFVIGLAVGSASAVELVVGIEEEGDFIVLAYLHGIAGLIPVGEIHHGKDITVAIMGCAVNGPGEAREADVGIAGGVGEGLLFRRGETVGKVPQSEIIPTLIAEIRKIAEE